MPSYRNYVEKALELRIISEIKLIEKEIALFQIDNDALPDSLADIGLDTLRDPWGNPYQYLSHADSKGKGKGKGGIKARSYQGDVPVNTDYDLYSMGPDGKSAPAFTSNNSLDDIVRANNGQFIGSVFNY